MSTPVRPVLRIGLLLLTAALDLILLAPLWRPTSLAPDQVKNVYFEPLPAGVAAMLDTQQGGYVTEIAVDPDGQLGVPAGRSIAFPLPSGTTVTVRTLAADLAPYIVLGTGTPADESASAQRFTDGVVLMPSADGLAPSPWDPSRPWATDRAWLRELHRRCDLPARAQASIRATTEATVIEIGACSVRLPPPAASRSPLLLVATGPHAASVTSPRDAWRRTYALQWPLIGVVLLRVAVLGFAVGAGPTAVTSAALLAVAQISRPEAIMCWAATLPIAIAISVGRLIARRAPRRPGLAWSAGAAAFAAQVGGLVVAVALFDVGTFGKVRITRQGDDACAVVGYSTVRGDSLRQGTPGIVEQLGAACAPCRGRTSRFSREAQTLRWIRETVCSPSFPSPAGGQVIFVGGGNDDLFYRSARLSQALADFATVLRVSLQPIEAADWQQVFDRASGLAGTTLDEQTADLAAIAQCAQRDSRQLRFVHDFLIWDLESGRSAVRQRAFERRRAAVQTAGGDFVDLLAELAGRVGVAWFNDFIHPSAAGQQMIAELLCQRLTAGQPGRNPPPPEARHAPLRAMTANPLDTRWTIGASTTS